MRINELETIVLADEDIVRELVMRGGRLTKHKYFSPIRRA